MCACVHVCEASDCTDCKLLPDNLIYSYQFHPVTCVVEMVDERHIYRIVNNPKWQDICCQSSKSTTYLKSFEASTCSILSNGCQIIQSTGSTQQLIQRRHPGKFKNCRDNAGGESSCLFSNMGQRCDASSAGFIGVL